MNQLSDDSLIGPTCVLRTVAPTDLEYLYRLATEGEGGVRWRFHGAQVPIESFFEALCAGVVAHFVVALREGAPIGYVSAYGGDLRNGYCFIGVTIEGHALGAGFGGEAGVLLIRYLFKSYPFRKLYAEIPDFTVESVESRMRGLFVREGILRQHFFADGRFCDQHLFATYREQWGVEEIETTFAKRAGRPFMVVERSELHPISRP